MSQLAEASQVGAPLRRFKHGVERILFHFLALLMLSLVIVVGLQIVSRYVFNASIPWSEEVSRLLLVWSTMLGAGLASFLGVHLRIDLFADRWGARGKLISAFVIALATLSFLLILFLGNFEMIEIRESIPFTSFPGISSKYLSYAVSVGSLLMMFGTLLGLFLHVSEFMSKRRQ